MAKVYELTGGRILCQGAGLCGHLSVMSMGEGNSWCNSVRDSYRGRDEGHSSPPEKWNSHCSLDSVASEQLRSWHVS